MFGIESCAGAAPGAGPAPEGGAAPGAGLSERDLERSREI